MMLPMPSTAPTLVAASAVLTPVPPEPTPDPSPFEAVVVDPLAELVLLLSAPPAAAVVVETAVDVLLPASADATGLTEPLPPSPPPPHERRSATNRGDKLLSQSLVVMICCRLCLMGSRHPRNRYRCRHGFG